MQLNDKELDCALCFVADSEMGTKPTSYMGSSAHWSRLAPEIME
jgi:hypothetical protein